MQIKIKLDNLKGVYGFKRDVPDGINLITPDIVIKKQFGIKETLEFIVEASRNIEFGLIAAYLASKCTDYHKEHKSDNLQINGVTIKFNDGKADRVEIENIIKTTTSQE